MVVFLDVYIVINLIMDFIILCISKRMMRLKASFLRIVLASATGAFFAVIYIVLNNLFDGLGDLGRQGIQIITQILGGMLMCAVAFNQKKKKLIVSFGVITLVSILLSGSINYIYYMLPSGKSFLSFIAVAIISYIAINGIVDLYIEKTSKYKPVLYDVLLCFKDRSVRTMGLLDSGNRLVTPMSQKMVHVVQKDIVSSLFSNIEIGETKIIIIPFNSIGKKGGSMIGVEIDKMVVNGDKEFAKPVIALYEGKLSSDGRFKMLLNAGLLKE